jgi:hypothetical protein
MQVVKDFYEKRADQEDPYRAFLYKAEPPTPHKELSHNEVSINGPSPNKSSANGGHSPNEHRIYPPFLPSAHWLIGIAVRLVWIVLKGVVITAIRLPRRLHDAYTDISDKRIKGFYIK